jgi:hypothetical protein
VRSTQSRRFLGTQVNFTKHGTLNFKTYLLYSLLSSSWGRFATTNINKFRHSRLSFLSTLAINIPTKACVHLLCPQRTNWWKVHTSHSERQFPLQYQGQRSRLFCGQASSICTSISSNRTKNKCFKNLKILLVKKVLQPAKYKKETHHKPYQITFVPHIRHITNDYKT